MEFQDLPLGAITLDDSSGESFRSTSSEPSTPSPVPRPKMGPWSTKLHPGPEDDPPAPYLCQACLSILTMDGLEIGKPYSHHDSLKSLLAAHQMGCNICCRAFWGTQAEDFMVLAEGSVPMTMPGYKDHPTDDDNALSSSEISKRKIQDYWRRTRFEETFRYTEDKETLISFTGLWISGGMNSLTVCMRLNPSYEEFIPIGMQTYQKVLWESWRFLAHRICEFCERQLITAQGTSRPIPDNPSAQLTQ